MSVSEISSPLTALVPPSHRMRPRVLMPATIRPSDNDSPLPADGCPPAGEITPSSTASSILSASCTPTSLIASSSFYGGSSALATPTSSIPTPTSATSSPGGDLALYGRRREKGFPREGPATGERNELPGDQANPCEVASGIFTDESSSSGVRPFSRQSSRDGLHPGMVVAGVAMAAAEGRATAEGQRSAALYPRNASHGATDATGSRLGRPAAILVPPRPTTAVAGSATVPAGGGGSPFAGRGTQATCGTWDELERSSRFLDSLSIRLEGIDLTDILSSPRVPPPPPSEASTGFEFSESSARLPLPLGSADAETAPVLAGTAAMPTAIPLVAAKPGSQWESHHRRLSSSGASASSPSALSSSLSSSFSEKSISIAESSLVAAAASVSSGEVAARPPPATFAAAPPTSGPWLVARQVSLPRKNPSQPQTESGSPWRYSQGQQGERRPGGRGPSHSAAVDSGHPHPHHQNQQQHQLSPHHPSMQRITVAAATVADGAAPHRSPLRPSHAAKPTGGALRCSSHDAASGLAGTRSIPELWRALPGPLRQSASVGEVFSLAGAQERGDGPGYGAGAHSHATAAMAQQGGFAWVQQGGGNAAGPFGSSTIGPNSGSSAVGPSSGSSAINASSGRRMGRHSSCSSWETAPDVEVLSDCGTPPPASTRSRTSSSGRSSSMALAHAARSVVRSITDTSGGEGGVDSFGTGSSSTRSVDGRAARGSGGSSNGHSGRGPGGASTASSSTGAAGSSYGLTENRGTSVSPMRLLRHRSTTNSASLNRHGWADFSHVVAAGQDMWGRSLTTRAHAGADAAAAAEEAADADVDADAELDAQYARISCLPLSPLRSILSSRGASFKEPSPLRDSAAMGPAAAPAGSAAAARFAASPGGAGAERKDPRWGSLTGPPSQPGSPAFSLQERRRSGGPALQLQGRHATAARAWGNESEQALGSPVWQQQQQLQQNRGRHLQWQPSNEPALPPGSLISLGSPQWAGQRSQAWQSPRRDTPSQSARRPVASVASPLSPLSPLGTSSGRLPPVSPKPQASTAAAAGAAAGARAEASTLPAFSSSQRAALERPGQGSVGSPSRGGRREGKLQGAVLALPSMMRSLSDKWRERGGDLPRSPLGGATGHGEACGAQRPALGPSQSCGGVVGAAGEGVGGECLLSPTQSLCDQRHGRAGGPLVSHSVDSEPPAEGCVGMGSPDPSMRRRSSNGSAEKRWLHRHSSAKAGY